MLEETGGGGGDLTQVEADLLRSGALEAANTAEELNGMLSALLEKLDPLVKAWTGSAGGLYQKVQEQLAINMSNLYGALTSIATEMGISSDEFTLSDEEIGQDLAAVGFLSEGEITNLLGSGGGDTQEAVASGGSPTAITEAMNNA
jgi:WXG100 family type VII secretion target